jgi:hypothetical protein
MQQPMMPTMGGMGMPQMNMSGGMGMSMGGMGQTASGASGGQSKDQQYFLDCNEAEKHIKHCTAEINFNNA